MSKEKSTVEVKDEKQQLTTRKETLVNKAKTEKRTLTSEETTQLNEIATRMVDIDAEIADLEAMNKRKGTPRNQPKRFSLLRAIGESISGTYSDESLEVIERGRAQMSGMETTGSLLIPVEDRAAVVAGTPANGGAVIDTDILDIMTPLTANLILAQVGANIVTGLTTTYLFRNIPALLQTGQVKPPRLKMVLANSANRDSVQNVWPQ